MNDKNVWRALGVVVVVVLSALCLVGFSRGTDLRAFPAGPTSETGLQLAPQFVPRRAFDELVLKVHNMSAQLQHFQASLDQMRQLQRTRSEAAVAPPSAQPTTIGAIPVHLAANKPPTKSQLIVLGRDIPTDRKNAVQGLIVHMVRTLRDWKLQIFYTADSAASANALCALNHNIECVDLGYRLATRRAYTALMKNISFWKRVAGEKVLIFQTDSIVCKNAKRKVEVCDGKPP